MATELAGLGGILVSGLDGCHVLGWPKTLFSIFP